MTDSTLIADWRPAPGFEGVYEVHRTGRVRRIVGGRGARAGQLLKPRIRARGYHAVVLHDGDNVREFRLHRLVALAFLSCADPDAMEVNHIDGDPANNDLSNLEWATGSRNLTHSWTLGRRNNAGCHNGRAKLTEPQVRAIRTMRGHRTAVEVAHEYGVSNQLVSAIWRREVWAHVA